MGLVTRMRNVLRRCLWLVFLSSLGLLLASFTGVGRRASGRHLRFEPNPLVIPETMQSGEEYDLDVAVVNESGEPARIIRALDYCAGSCFSGRGIPAVIPAKGWGWVKVHVRAGSTGILSGQLTFYTDRPSQAALTLKLDGTVQDDRSHDLTTQLPSP